ncbi:SDR family oxidoreductase [Polymorphobacter sp.]|uniref:SDR family oxidoreductase n=1 Tax=Polymorphobacter sp. TaxID=1909290 RepID=UPI003F6F4E74
MDVDVPPTDPGAEAALEPKPEWQPRYKGSERLTGKVAVITGGDSGIGRAVAALFAREGADVAILHLGGVEEEEDARETCRIVEGEGRQALAIAGDLADEVFCRSAIDDVIEVFGRLDILVNNAGEQHPSKDIGELPSDQFERIFATNVFGMFYLTKAARAHLGKGAAIINTTSVTSFAGSDELVDYSATKGAITSFTRALAQQLAEAGIRVNAVAPGPIWTPLNPFGGATPEKLETFGESTPMGRPGQPNEVAPSYLFLACEDTSYMTGQVLHPNGGISVGG